MQSERHGSRLARGMVTVACGLLVSAGAIADEGLGLKVDSLRFELGTFADHLVSVGPALGGIGEGVVVDADHVDVRIGRLRAGFIAVDELDDRRHVFPAGDDADGQGETNGKSNDDDHASDHKRRV